jgi:predicted  nucleic acid-binding Zn-ribbon protein
LQEKLKALAELQKVDLEIAGAKKAADVYPRQMAELEKTLGAAKSLVDAERAKLADLEREKQSLEQNIVDEKDKVKKWEARLAEQRSTREYSALAREIDIAKKANLTMSEQVVELGRQVAAQRELLKSREQEFLARADQIGGQLTELKGKIGAFQGQLKNFEEKRSAAASKVDRPLLNRYESIRKKRLPALVAVLAPGTCQGCNMNVRPQLYNTLRTTAGTDECPSCHRIIYAGEAIDLTK